jgi:hypothetical protein
MVNEPTFWEAEQDAVNERADSVDVVGSEAFVLQCEPLPPTARNCLPSFSPLPTATSEPAAVLGAFVFYPPLAIALTSSRSTNVLGYSVTPAAHDYRHSGLLYYAL